MDRPDRQHLRYAHEAAVTLYLAGEQAGDVAVLSGRTRNVSRGGLCATLWQPVQVGGALEVDIQLVFHGDHQSEALRVPARVVWCTAVDDTYQVGLQFCALDDDTVADLTMFLRYLDDRRASTEPPPMSRAARAAAAARMPIDERFG